MGQGEQPMFGERVVSWRTVWNGLYPYTYDPHDDAVAAEMHRLRGLVVAQASEVESVLGEILGQLDPSATVRRRTAGQLSADIKKLLEPRTGVDWADTMILIDRAINRRNHAAHSPVEIGSVWRDYATGDGGEWVPVVSAMDGDVYAERDLRVDLALQQKATDAAVRLLYFLSRQGE